MNEHNDILKALRLQMKDNNEPEGYPLQVPDDYFSGLNNKILSKVLDEESAGLIPFADIDKKQTFTVPDGYFDNLEKDILKKTIAPAPVRRLFSSKWRPIAAASIIGFIILVGTYYWENADSGRITVQNKPAGTSIIQNVSVNELSDFVGEATTGNISDNDKKISVDINQLFQQVSSQDLESFLNETAVNNTELF
ncbi:hypothetical protein ACLOAU_10165 [Niabella sp. CJ426]|uniref:hypothetical protein n=1 Tax=Niabella sp. CJ426 TaxID=3393740 RepID=UPI003D007836